MVDKFSIHLFTSEDVYPDEAKILTRLLNAGLDVLHIRKPTWSASKTESLLQQIPGRFNSRIVLHEQYPLAKKYDCGIQLNGRCCDASDNAIMLSRSCHSLPEVRQNRHLEFVTLSPIFDSISKSGYASCFSDVELKQEDLSNVIALGGVTLDSIPQLSHLGFAGAALLGEVWNKPDGVNRFLKYLLMRNFSLQFITDGKNVTDTISQAITVLNAGGKWIQVRMKNSGKHEIREVLQVLLPHCEQKGATLLVDDHFELAEYCHGVHLGQNDANVADVRRVISSDKIIGLTVNNLAQIAISRFSLPDYYGVGPYRFTSTKKNLSPVLGLNGYLRLSPEIPAKFVAIGGILPEDIPALLDAGASGIAVSSVITRSENPFKETQKLIHIINEK